jgi:hypothetical protein
VGVGGRSPRDNPRTDGFGAAEGSAPGTRNEVPAGGTKLARHRSTLRRADCYASRRAPLPRRARAPARLLRCTVGPRPLGGLSRGLGGASGQYPGRTKDCLPGRCRARRDHPSGRRHHPSDRRGSRCCPSRRCSPSCRRENFRNALLGARRRHFRMRHSFVLQVQRHVDMRGSGLQHRGRLPDGGPHQRVRGRVQRERHTVQHVQRRFDHLPMPGRGRARSVRRVALRGLASASASFSALDLSSQTRLSDGNQEAPLVRALHDP